MLPSNSVSTIFRCMSCSFRAHDQNAYAEHIKHCSNESTAMSTCTSAHGKIQRNLLKTVKNCQPSYFCSKCLVPTGCPRSRLLHLRDVHGEDMQIFICKFCSRFAARLRKSVYNHAVRVHRREALKHRSCAELLQKTVNKQFSTGTKASVGKDRISKAKATSCDQNENSISHTRQYAVKSSGAFGLQFLGKQHSGIGRDEYVCKLCSFSHFSCPLVVKHIWEDHKDKFSEMVLSEADAATDDVDNASMVYKCDECGFTTNVKSSLYGHCAHHQFNGPSKCPYCSYCALNDAAIVPHVRKCHDSRDLIVKHIDPKLESDCSKTGASSKAVKSLYKKQHAFQHIKNWYACPYCSFKSHWYKSVYRHKLKAHAKLSTACRKTSSVDSVSPNGHRLMKMDASNTAVGSCNTAEVQGINLPTSAHQKQRAFTCDICLAKYKSLAYLHIHKEIHADLKRYQCPLCGLRANFLSNIHKHASHVHKHKNISAITLSLEDAKQTIEAYRKHLKTKRYQCQHCGFSSHSMSCIRKHTSMLHRDENVSIIPLTSEDSEKTTETCRKHEVSADTELSNTASRKRSSTDNPSPRSHKVKKDTDDALETSSSEQSLPNHKVLAAESTSQKKKAYMCDICPVKCKTLWHWYKHKQVHADLRCYQCPLCGLRSNYSSSVQTHINAVHIGAEAEVVRLTVEDAKQTIEAYRNQPRKQVELYMDLKCYQCSLCGLRSNCLGNIQTHITTVHKGKKAQTVKLSLEDAKQTIEAYNHRHCVPKRYQCSLCDCRSNHLESMRKHISSKHKGKRAQAISLLLEDTDQTTKVHERQPVAPSHAQPNDVHFTATERRNKLSHAASRCKSVEHKTSPASCDSSASSSEQSSVQMQMKQHKIHTSDESHPHSGTDVLYYACSLCKRQSKYKSPIVRHVRTVHLGRKARVLTVKRKMPVQKSQLPFQRKTSKSLKLSAQTSSRNSKEYGDGSVVEVKKQNAVKHNMSENDDELMQEPGLADASHCVPVQIASVNPKGLTTHSCDICPYRAKCLNQVINHQKLHVERPGYSFVCNICPYFACQASHLEQHVQLHSKKPDQNTNVKAHLHLCKYCPLFTDNMAMFLAHGQLHRPRRCAKFKCEQCPLWVKYSRDLCRHAKVHAAEYMQKRMERIQSVQALASVDVGVNDMVSEECAVTSPLTASGSTREDDRLIVTNVSVADECKLDEVSPNKFHDRDLNKSMVNGESLVGVTGENADASACPDSAAPSHQLPSWCCERCPYSTRKLAFFKRHVWLHGKQSRYICRYCDYSVQSYWQLVSHLLWHFAPNKHLVYAQSVSNLDSLPSELPNRNSIPDSLVSVDRFVPSFENSDAFQLSDVANFQCSHCPFVTEQRSEFFSHILCHCVRTDAHKCLYCTFHCDLPELLSKHILLHFNLPGCSQSSLPPSLCHLDDWKQLIAAIKPVAERSTCITESHDATMQNCNSWSSSHVELLKADAMVSEKEAIRPSVCGDGNTSVFTAVSQSAMSDAKSLSDNKQHTSVTHSTVSADNSLTADNMTSTVMSKPMCCHYCDKVIDDSDTLLKHEADHLIGCPMPWH